MLLPVRALPNAWKKGGQLEVQVVRTRFVTAYTITIKWCHGRCVFDVLQLQSVFGANHRWVAMGPIFGMWEVWVETTRTHCLGRHTKLTPPGPPFRPANSSSRYWFRIQSRELELKTFTPIIQQCFQSCIHTAYSPYYSNIHGPLESLAHDSETKNSKIFFLPKAAKKNVYVPFPPLSPEIDCRHGNSVGGHWRIWEAEMITNGDTSLFTYCTFSWEKPWCLSNGCYY